MERVFSDKPIHHDPVANDLVTPASSHGNAKTCQAAQPVTAIGTCSISPGSSTLMNSMLKGKSGCYGIIKSSKSSIHIHPFSMSLVNSLNEWHFYILSCPGNATGCETTCFLHNHSQYSKSGKGHDHNQTDHNQVG